MPFNYDKLPADLVLPQGGKRRRIFLAGKGGVGKTTLASTTALFAADQGFKTLLVTTDPAAHIGNVFGETVTSVPRCILDSNLWLVRIDPKVAFDAYRQKVLGSLEQQFEDTETVERVSEELNSPCTEEVAVFQEFLDYVLSEEFEVTVFDTAPTGHTIRLLQLSWDYEAELEHKDAFTAETAALDDTQLARMNAAIRTLQDQQETGMLFVTLPETTPIAEMERAISDLERTHIHTQGIIVNQVLPEEAATSRLFGKRLELQMGHIRRLKECNTNRTIAVATLQDDEIIGFELLQRFSDDVIEKPKETIQ
ncbi:ArsA family ATPase [Alicyclobacillus tolerans]|uniref:Arsenite efflux ATP-binding protein ArsA n=1 Tax=Alicyclobacillus tolerans TaxID=90970 RepID=A0A1M6XPY1_9BACL|nr:ArsA family ATPase [Alicyclobacillus montanus]SHL08021.1 arsenite efflux ATP-binding protein ArsA [Alicyclobacillus montanus]